MIDEKKMIEDLKNYCGKQPYLVSENIWEIINSQPKIGGWIPCSERLPEEKINPVTNDFYEYQVTFKSDKVTDVRHYKFGRGHWWNCGQNMDKYVTAWREPLEAYHG
mgnify:CR=1 FL=1